MDVRVCKQRIHRTRTEKVKTGKEIHLAVVGTWRLATQAVVAAAAKLKVGGNF